MALAPHTGARASFITSRAPKKLTATLIKHWLADILNMSLRCEKTTPDDVTRVFMPPHRVTAGDLALWELASARAAGADGATFWADVVGVDASRAADSELFRVLEWCGMEVCRSL